MGFLYYFRRRRYERHPGYTAQPSQPIPGDTLGHDDDSIQPMLPSYQQAADSTDGHSTSDLHSPCVCGPHQGCCRTHNSLRSPNRGLLGQSRTLLWTQGFTPSDNHDLKTKVGNHEAGESTPGPESALTITPVHAVMAYHLSLDHLECIRGRLKPGTAMAFIPELSQKDNCASEIGTSYSWSNEIYFHQGTFLQKQEIDCYQHRQDANQPQHFTACPHQSLTVSAPRFSFKKQHARGISAVDKRPAPVRVSWKREMAQHSRTICPNRQLHDLSLRRRVYLEAAWPQFAHQIYLLQRSWSWNRLAPV